MSNWARGLLDRHHNVLISTENGLGRSFASDGFHFRGLGAHRTDLTSYLRMGLGLGLVQMVSTSEGRVAPAMLLVEMCSGLLESFCPNSSTR